MFKRCELISIPCSVVVDRRLSESSKILYGIIMYFCNKDGSCTESNYYFTNFLGVSKITISALIKLLEDEGYITRRIVKNDRNEVVERILKLTDKVDMAEEVKIIGEKKRYLTKN